MSIGMVVLALTVGLDVFASGLALGVKGLDGSRWPRVALIFGILTLALLVIGIAVGTALSESLGKVAAYLAGAALLLLGARAVAEAFRKGYEHPDVIPSLDIRAILTTGVLVNPDKLAVGISLAILESTPIALVAYVSVQGVAATWAGLMPGRRLGVRMGEAAAVLSGLVFVLLGALIVLDAAAGGNKLSSASPVVDYETPCRRPCIGFEMR